MEPVVKKTKSRNMFIDEHNLNDHTAENGTTNTMMDAFNPGKIYATSVFKVFVPPAKTANYSGKDDTFSIIPVYDQTAAANHQSSMEPPAAIASHKVQHVFDAMSSSNKIHLTLPEGECILKCIVEHPDESRSPVGAPSLQSTNPIAIHNHVEVTSPEEHDTSPNAIDVVLLVDAVGDSFESSTGAGSEKQSLRSKLETNSEYSKLGQDKMLLRHESSTSSERNDHKREKGEKRGSWRNGLPDENVKELRIGKDHQKVHFSNYGVTARDIPVTYEPLQQFLEAVYANVEMLSDDDCDENVLTSQHQKSNDVEDMALTLIKGAYRTAVSVVKEIAAANENEDLKKSWLPNNPTEKNSLSDRDGHEIEDHGARKFSNNSDDEECQSGKTHQLPAMLEDFVTDAAINVDTIIAASKGEQNATSSGERSTVEKNDMGNEVGVENPAIEKPVKDQEDATSKGSTACCDAANHLESAVKTLDRVMAQMNRPIPTLESLIKRAKDAKQAENNSSAPPNTSEEGTITNQTNNSKPAFQTVNASSAPLDASGKGPSTNTSNQSKPPRRDLNTISRETAGEGARQITQMKPASEKTSQQNINDDSSTNQISLATTSQNAKTSHAETAGRTDHHYESLQASCAPSMDDLEFIPAFMNDPEIQIGNCFKEAYVRGMKFQLERDIVIPLDSDLGVLNKVVNAVEEISHEIVDRPHGEKARLFELINKGSEAGSLMEKLVDDAYIDALAIVNEKSSFCQRSNKADLETGIPVLFKYLASESESSSEDDDSDSSGSATSEEDVVSDASTERGEHSVNNVSKLERVEEIIDVGTYTESSGHSKTLLEDRKVSTIKMASGETGLRRFCHIVGELKHERLLFFGALICLRTLAMIVAGCFTMDSNTSIYREISLMALTTCVDAALFFYALCRRISGRIKAVSRLGNVIND